VRLTIPLILASASPRRNDLLRELVHDFTVITADDVEEAHDAALSPAELTGHNARLKAAAVARHHPEAIVLGADTLVYLDNTPLGKPADKAEAETMLRQLSGRTHTVCTGVCLHGPGPDTLISFHDLTQVTFRVLDESLIATYLDRVPVLDKAGAYAAQDHGHLIIEKIDGSLSTVIGLPVEALAQYLAPWEAHDLPAGD
jgi:septum formation protein